jgi:hypothetical protein
MRWLAHQLKAVIRVAQILDLELPEIPPDASVPYEGHAGEVITVGDDETTLIFDKKNWDLVCYIPGVPDAAETLLKFKFSRDITFNLDDWSDNQAELDVATTNQYVVSFKKGAVEQFTLTFEAGQTTGSFSTPAYNVSFLKGEVLVVESPTPADATAEGVSFSLNGKQD